MKRHTTLAVAALGAAVLGLVVSACSSGEPARTSAPGSQPPTSAPVSRNMSDGPTVKRELARSSAQTVQPAAPAPAASASRSAALDSANQVGGSANPNDDPYDAVFFRHYGVNPFVDTEDDHLSTFAMDVDTASYTVARRLGLDSENGQGPGQEWGHTVHRGLWHGQLQ